MNPVLDELKIFTGNGHPALAKSVCDYLEIPLGEAEVFKFANDNSFARIKENIRQRDVFIVQPTCFPVNDNLMGDYFECCTDVPMDEVKKIIKGDPRSAKVRLAKEIVTLYHDEKAAEEASKAFDKVFTDKEVPDDMTEIKVKKGTKVIDVIVENKLVSSKSEARRVIEQGGVKLNDKAVDSIDTEVEEGLTPEALAKGVTLKVGKRKFLKVII